MMKKYLCEMMLIAFFLSAGVSRAEMYSCGMAGSVSFVEKSGIMGFSGEGKMLCHSPLSGDYEIPIEVHSTYNYPFYYFSSGHQYNNSNNFYAWGIALENDLNEIFRQDVLGNYFDSNWYPGTQPWMIDAWFHQKKFSMAFFDKNPELKRDFMKFTPKPGASWISVDNSGVGAAFPKHCDISGIMSGQALPPGKIGILALGSGVANCMDITGRNIDFPLRIQTNGSWSAASGSSDPEQKKYSIKIFDTYYVENPSSLYSSYSSSSAGHVWSPVIDFRSRVAWDLDFEIRGRMEVLDAYFMFNLISTEVYVAPKD